MRRSRLAICLLLLLLAWACVSCSVSLAKENTQLVITHLELCEWEKGLNRRMTINALLRSELEALQQELVESKTALNLAKEELAMLKQELVTSKALLSKQTRLLEQTEESYKQSRKEPRQEMAAKVNDGAVAGISYGRAYRLANTGVFLGLRLGYDWQEDKSELWATVGW